MLHIQGEDIELRDAAHLWGLDTEDTVDALETETAKKTKYMVIGPGGENGVRYACILTGTRHAAGRTGMGAVMGSKNLKAISVRKGNKRGTQNSKNRDVLRDYVKRITSASRYASYARFSNSNYVNWANEAGILATRNYQKTKFEGAKNIDGDRLIKYVTRSKSCYRCPVHCKAEIEISEGEYAGTRGERPDIEPIINLGSKCGLDDPEVVLYLHNLAGKLGIDVISTAGALAFAMELFERGIISVEETDGLELTWGNAEAMAEMMKRIAWGDGFGAVLGQGVRRAAEIIGGNAASYAYHSKGLELTAYDPRGGMGTALGYAVSTRGGDFTSVYAVPEYRWEGEQSQEFFGTEKAVDRTSIEGKGKLIRWTMIVSAVLDSLGLCKVPVLSVVGDYTLENEAELMTAIIGQKITSNDLLRTGERIINQEKIFNLRHGAGRHEDDLPDHFTENPVPDPGPTYGMTVNIQPMVRDFYEAMGWDEEGRPTPKKLDELGL